MIKSLVAFCTLVFISTSANATTHLAPLTGLDLRSGQRFTQITDPKTKATVIVFLSARCPCSSSHEAALKSLFNQFSTQGFQFIGIHSNADEPVQESQEHFVKAALPFPVIQDNAAQLADQFKALKTPHVFILNSQGETLFQGGVDDSHIAATAKKHYLDEALAALSQGNLPPQKEVRTVGCVIKRP